MQKLRRWIRSRGSPRQPALDRDAERHGQVRISAVVCAYNRHDFVIKAVDSLLRQDFPLEQLEILVIDNGSAPPLRSDARTLEWVNSRRVRIVEEPRLGLAHARNRAIAESRAPYIAFLDDDAVASPNWAARIAAAFQQVRDIGALGGAVLPEWGAERPNWLGKELEVLYSTVNWSNHARFLGAGETLIGANVAYDRLKIKSLGGFNTNLGRRGKSLLSSEEAALHNLLAKQGLKQWYDPEIRVLHHIHADRLNIDWATSRAYWQGISAAISWRSSPDRSPLLLVAKLIYHSLLLGYDSLKQWLFGIWRPRSADWVAAKCWSRRRSGMIKGLASYDLVS